MQSERDMMKTKDIIVVGGGASGMMAAISARKQGNNVTILERNPRVGKKILATGNGRCNYTNINAGVEKFYGRNHKFPMDALSIFSWENTIEFFEKIGIEKKVEDFGKVFPMSEQASSILDVLLYQLNDLGVHVICNAFVKKISKKKGRFVINLEQGQTYYGDRVIISTGGKAMPSSGSDGNGYDLAIKLGHSIVDVFPSLVQLMLEGPYFKRLDGVKFEGTAEILDKDQSIAKDRGDILFANYGVSGPPILQISRKANELLIRRKEAILKINIMDGFTKDELKTLIKRRFVVNPNMPVDFSFVGLINKRLIPVILKEAGVDDIKRKASDIMENELINIVNILTDWRFVIRGTKSWTSAQTTAGGVSTEEIDSRTMESKIVKGLFFTGEIMDVDGKCGGYNLQWAWSSGYIAGVNVGKKTL